MTLVSNSPNMWPDINFHRMESYCAVIGSTAASTVVVIYDWGKQDMGYQLLKEFLMFLCYSQVLTFEQEVELVWKRRWSVMSVLYLTLRYGGIIYAILDIPGIFFVFNQEWVFTIANIILGVIMIARLHAMYQRSRKMLIFLVVFFLALTITSGVITVTQNTHLTAEEVVLSGTHQCEDWENSFLLSAITWILGTVWEALALYLSVRIAIKHFRERLSTGSIIEDCFTVLIKSHVFYFASFLAVASLYMSSLSPSLRNGVSAGDVLYHAVMLLSSLLQMFLLGPRLILSVREHSTRLVDDSDGATAMTTIAFQERTPVSTNSGV
ncbi:uncharacterized protein F5147DRAFT_840604 [Suillus discolor]|uniref:DUF6533 domain-containing protein n=1 Tax=Suillus discolor TaxID=1912936 RepID=A0A9P7EW91_9AGAM|nr:uncharacterized protein F5147DRAFT_840604 [Suillus discolor]KAG2092657.1 hypothetical protein F5147DRAFT_840604 [Suillus discolor]